MKYGHFRGFVVIGPSGIASRSLSYSDEDHLLTAADAVYAYDLDGFLTSKTKAGLVTAYTYSIRGELLNVQLPDGRTVSYDHDPLGRRIAKRIDGAIVEKYLWQDRTRLLAVYDGSDNLIQRFEYADGRMPVAMTQAGSRYFLAYDQVGSLRVVTDSSGNIVKRIDYDTFGNILNDTNSSLTLPFGFAGGLHDRDTGLVRFGHRDYDPDTGRWTAKDPIGFAGGDTDLYGYCSNDPVNWVDPWGLEAEALPGPIPLPIIVPKTDAQIEADRQLADWLRDHYNPNWFQDTLDLLWNDPIDYWFGGIASDSPCLTAKDNDTKIHDKRNKDQINSDDIQDLIDKEQEIKHDYPDQPLGKTKQRIKDMLKDYTRR